MQTSIYENPFADPVFRDFWDIGVKRDLEAFLAQDWDMTAVDFSPDNFFGIDANGSMDPAKWLPKYSTLDTYRKDFVIQSREFSEKRFAEDPREALYRALSLSEPVIDGNRAIMVKRFNGEIREESGSITELKWKSLFHFIKQDRWLITGFVGYLPL